MATRSFRSGMEHQETLFVWGIIWTHYLYADPPYFVLRIQMHMNISSN